MKLKVGIYFDGAYFCYASNYFNEKNKNYIEIKKFISSIELFLIEEYLLSTSKFNPADFNFVVRKNFNSTDKKLESSLNHNILVKKFNKVKIVSSIHPLIRDKQKGIDVDLAYNIGKDIISKKLNLIILVASDMDFKPILDDLRKKETIKELKREIKSCIVNLSIKDCENLLITDLHKSSDFVYNFWEYEEYYKQKSN